ncbi:MAG: type I secretion system permease/ATPase [Alphaproteobacteria bacterium]|nr:MAG: type I secretion system permease/ATPase [Alphaproteobacteria bacterium]
MSSSVHPGSLTLLTKALREARRGFVPVAVFSLFFNLLMLVSPIYMMQVFDRVLTSGRTETLLVLTAIAMVALLVLGQMDTYRQRLLTRIGVWLDQTLALPVLTGAMKISLQGAPVGAQPLRDLAQIRSFGASPAIFPLLDAPWVPLFLGLIFILHPLLGVIATLGAAILFGLAWLNELATRTALRQASEAQVSAFNQAEKTIAQSEVVEAMGLGPNLLSRWAEANNKVLSAQNYAGDRAAEISGLTKFFRLALQIGIMGAGAWLVLRGQLTSGGMIAASILLGRGLAPVEQSIGAWKAWVSARTAFDRLNKLLAACPAEPERMALAKPKGQVSVEGLSFAPKGVAKPILRNISFALKPGEALAIIGPSAAGKSTLCRMLAGIYPPTVGHVRLDGADVHLWDRSDFGTHVGYLPQAIDLFDGTIADNIARMGNPDSVEVLKAAKLAGVHDMILRLPEGYDTKVKQGAHVLSGGQLQRIGLARALYGDPCLLILDEPNSNLDQEGEAALMRALDQLRAKGTAIVMVAHRSSVISHVDKLLLLQNGEVQMFGPCEEVIQKMSAKRVVQGGRGQ